MSEPLKVGDICIFQNARYHKNANGMEVTIVAVNYWGRDHNQVYQGYLLDQTTPAGHEWVAFPDQLRKKRPPTSAKSIMREAINKAKQPVEVTS